MAHSSFAPDAVAQHIVAWLQDYLAGSGLDGWVVGVSGGIDSAVTSTLCAMTGAPITCVEMPIHQAPDQVNRASEHMEASCPSISVVSGPSPPNRGTPETSSLTTVWSLWVENKLLL